MHQCQRLPMSVYREQGCNGRRGSERASEWRQSKREWMREEKSKTNESCWVREWTSEESAVVWMRKRPSEAGAGLHPTPTPLLLMWSDRAIIPALLTLPLQSNPQSLPLTHFKEGLTCQIKVMLSSEEMGSIVSDIRVGCRVRTDIVERCFHLFGYKQHKALSVALWESCRI